MSLPLDSVEFDRLLSDLRCAQKQSGLPNAEQLAADELVVSLCVQRDAARDRCHSLEASNRALSEAIRMADCVHFQCDAGGHDPAFCSYGRLLAAHAVVPVTGEAGRP